MGERQAQRQDSLDDQLRDLEKLAVEHGMYDAHDWMRNAASSLVEAREEIEGYKKYAEEGWEWLEEALDALGAKDVFHIKEAKAERDEAREELERAKRLIKHAELCLSDRISDDYEIPQDRGKPKEVRVDSALETLVRARTALDLHERRPSIDAGSSTSG